MGHLTSKDAYKTLDQRLNLFPQGAPPSESLFQILRVLFTEKEAQMVSQLPIRPFTIKKAAKIWQLSELETEKFLDSLCDKALLVDSMHKGVRRFVLPPPMIGFFEFSLMRMGGNVDQKLLSQLYHQYINVEEDFIKSLFADVETSLGRVFVQEPVLLSEHANHILDYERASYIIDSAEYVGVGTCYCRHKNLHLGIECEIHAPLETCLTLGNVARSLSEHGGYTRLISKSEAKDILSMCYESNLVQMGENVRNNPAFICNCCGCCCEALGAAKRFAPSQAIATSNYIPKLTADECVGCGKCAKVCPMDAIAMTSEEGGSHKVPVIDESICLGCGVCARNCPKKAIVLNRRPVQVITPVDTTHKFVLQAIETGTLQNLIFDNQAFANHRALAQILGAILKLPPIKQAMASKQFKSEYLDKLLSMQYKKK